MLERFFANPTVSAIGQALAEGLVGSIDSYLDNEQHPRSARFLDRVVLGIDQAEVTIRSISKRPLIDNLKKVSTHPLSVGFAIGAISTAALMQRRQSTK